MGAFLRSPIYDLLILLLIIVLEYVTGRNRVHSD